jgi:hypothetical protein
MWAPDPEFSWGEWVPGYSTPPTNQLYPSEIAKEGTGLRSYFPYFPLCRDLRIEQSQFMEERGRNLHLDIIKVKV